LKNNYLQRSYEKNPVVHFEMPYEDRERLVKFYEEAFGWQMQKMGEEITASPFFYCKTYTRDRSYFV